MSILQQLKVDRSWTLFLDRDGVINLHFPKDYVKDWSEFYFLEGVLDHLARLSNQFGKIVVVTNQQGVGKGLMSEDTLQAIHSNMMAEIQAAGGRIDSIYAATSLAHDDPTGLRKPKIGMAMQAVEDFPEIEFDRSIIVGDSITDMQFGRNAGMHTVFVTDKEKLDPLESLLVDFRITSLAELK
ncbi:MAG: HAD-IIIA family hydrolase [Chitinophagales bacterium]